MDKVECVVIGAGVIGLAIARRLAQAGREVDRAGSGRGHRHRHLLAQQRGDPRRHLLQGRQPDGADVRQRQTCALRLLREPWHPAQELRQADRRHHARTKPRSCNRSAHMPRPMACSTCRCFRATTARALEPALQLRRGAALALDRHHRQPCLHAGAARRRGSRRCGVRLSHAAAARQGRRRKDRARDRRRDADDARMRSSRQRRGPRCAGDRAQSSRACRSS